MKKLLILLAFMSMAVGCSVASPKNKPKPSETNHLYKVTCLQCKVKYQIRPDSDVVIGGMHVANTNGIMVNMESHILKFTCPSNHVFDSVSETLKAMPVATVVTNTP